MLKFLDREKPKKSTRIPQEMHYLKLTVKAPKGILYTPNILNLTLGGALPVS